MNNNTIMVMCGLDSHLGRVQRLLPQMRSVWDDRVDYAIGNFAAKHTNSTFPSTAFPGKFYKYPPHEIPVKLLKFAEDNKIQFCAPPRQEFIPQGREQHCCEFLGYLAISKYFYDMGYSSVYLLHTDIVAVDFLPKLELLISAQRGDWSFIFPEILRGAPDGPQPCYTQSGDQVEDRIRHRQLTIEAIKSGKITEATRQQSRCINSAFIINKKFVSALYEKYGTIDNMWEEVFQYLPMWGDIGPYGICEDFLGFNGVFIEEFVPHGCNYDAEGKNHWGTFVE